MTQHRWQWGVMSLTGTACMIWLAMCRNGLLILFRDVGLKKNTGYEVCDTVVSGGSFIFGSAYMWWRGGFNNKVYWGNTTIGFRCAADVP